ncbi:MAG: hypothetical protein ABIO31_09915 [Candidatus Nitrotoga sp.]
MLAISSFSGGVCDDQFQKIIAGAAWIAEVVAHIVHKLYAAPDQPISLNFPQKAYRKGTGNARGSLSDVMLVGFIKLLIILSGSDAKRRAVELNC